MEAYELTVQLEVEISLIVKYMFEFRRNGFLLSSLPSVFWAYPLYLDLVLVFPYASMTHT